jgi:hypothetical protein
LVASFFVLVPPAALVLLPFLLLVDRVLPPFFPL